MTDLPATIGRYQVARLIAHGGMGSLYLARDPAIDRLIAIKLLREGFEDDSLRERFAREARATGRLRHPNIVTVFDIGEHENRPFIAMEYVPGETLAQLIRRRAPVSIVEKLAILEDLCAALDYAHSAGIVHRDIKPANVMLEDVSGTLKVLDFGIAHAGEQGLTNAGEMVGTLNYMSPEQISGDSVDHRTDVYAVGALGYELLSYTRAFPGTIQDGTLLRILNLGPEPILTIVPDLDPGVAAIVERTMARDPVDRYQDMDRLRQDLAAARSRVIERGADYGVAPPASLDAESETMAAPAEGSGTARPTPTPGRTLRERPLSGSRGSSSIRRGTSPSAARANVAPSARAVEAAVDPTAVTSSSRPRRVGVALGATAAAMLAVVTITLVGMRSWGWWPRLPAQITTAPSQALPSGPAPAPTAPEADPLPKKVDAEGRRGLDEQLREIRATARRHLAAGRRQQALDALSAGLVLDASDPDLRNLVDEMARGARQEAARARADASRLGMTEDVSADVRDGRAREREADGMDRSGDRATAIRAFWAAIGLYERAGRVGTSTRSTPPARDSLAPTGTEKAPAPPPPDREQPAPATAPPSTATTDKPLAALPAVKPDPQPASPTEPPRVPPPTDVSAPIHDTLRRYSEAYSRLDTAAVGKVMPSLSPQQLRALDRDFANFRSYSVAITNERIVVKEATATVACEVVRSFVTRSGVAGGNTVATVFELRKTGDGWIIEKVGSR